MRTMLQCSAPQELRSWALASSPACRCTSHVSTSHTAHACHQQAVVHTPSSPCLPGRASQPAARHYRLVARAGESEGEVKPNTEFGYSRKDVLLIGTGVFVAGLGGYYGLQAAGVEAGMAGNFVQFGIFVLFAVGWVSSYLYRVLNKDMTYKKQLDAYENAVMNKRLEEMPESERERLYAEIDAERSKRQQR